MDEQLILVLDEGTTSTRAMLFTPTGALRGTAQRPLTQHYPQPGRVEHDAGEIWRETLGAAQDMVALAGGAQRIAAIGITNQRETVVAWDRHTGEPLARAIVWQDRRTADLCDQLRDQGHEPELQRRTGLLLDPYFSATKMRWLIDHEPAVARAAADGSLALGTVDSWLLFRLTGGRVHASDASNASRTLLLPLDGDQFDPALCALFRVPPGALPQVTDSAQTFGQGSGWLTDAALLGAPIPVTALAGDQQAATIGQGCLRPGDTKATYGTGAFVLANHGATPPRSTHRLLGTVLYQLDGQRTYALEGSVFVAGSLVQWLRDALGFVETAAQTEDMARSVPDSGGVVMVPALSGLGAPHWRPDVRGVISGLSFATGKAHIVRAALEAVAHQTHDLAGAFAADGAAWALLKIDGGMAANDWTAQDIADLLQLPVLRPALVETTALGAAMLAAVGAGIHPTLEAAAEAMIGLERRFDPAMADNVRAARLAGWSRALAAV